VSQENGSGDAGRDERDLSCANGRDASKPMPETVQSQLASRLQGYDAERGIVDQTKATYRLLRQQSEDMWPKQDADDEVTRNTWKAHLAG
jgi:hypothetical protein